MKVRVNSWGTSLAAFTGSQRPERQDHNAREDIRTRAKGDTGVITLRLTPDQWERIYQLTHSERVSLNRLVRPALSNHGGRIIEGFSP